MSSLYPESNGRLRLSFTVGGKRASLSLGKLSKATATRMQTFVDEMISHRQHGTQPSRGSDLSQWLSGLHKEHRKRLVAAGLVETIPIATMGELLEAFSESHMKKVKDTTAVSASQAIRNLHEFFRADYPVADVTIRDAEAFLQHLQTTPAKRGSGAPLAPDTVHRRFKTARAVFETAVRDDLIVKNPFRFVKAHGVDLTERQEYVPTEVVLRVIEAAPSLQWQLLIALSRFAGLRIPSEPRLLKWVDVDLAAKTMRITSTKNERHAGRKYRTCPITADLMPYLEAADKAPHDPDGFVFSAAIRNHTNLATMLRKQLSKLGIAPWAKTWHNLRFSCYTDFIDGGVAPATVSKMLGNTDSIGLRHYHDATSESLSKAAGISFVPQVKSTGDEGGGAESVRAMGKMGENRCSDTFIKSVKPLESPVFQCETLSAHHRKMTPTGLEPVSRNAGKYGVL